ncbi:hypothetical protein J1614_010490 [Plenodomus biglobosus]|nr:hypothetical protein J1614_010490 [Plenodomus biglobosus]
MSTNFTLTIPDLSPVCSNGLAQIPYTSPGVIALGPTRSERDILYNCCHVLSTMKFSINDTTCLQTAICTVQECSLADPTFACVAMMREVWGVQGVFGCGSRLELDSGAARMRGGLRWIVVACALVSIVAGMVI